MENLISEYRLIFSVRVNSPNIPWLSQVKPDCCMKGKIEFEYIANIINGIVMNFKWRNWILIFFLKVKKVKKIKSKKIIKSNSELFVYLNFRNNKNNVSRLRKMIAIDNLLLSKVNNKNENIKIYK